MKRSIAVTFTVLSCLAASRVDAQMHRLNAHLDVGGAFTGGGEFANDGGYFGRAGVSLPAGREVAFQIEASGFSHGLSGSCAIETGARCTPDFPNLTALTADMVVEMTDPFADHPLIALIGGGPARISNRQISPNMSFTVDAGLEAVLFRRARANRGHAVTLGVHVLYVARTDYGSFWVVPVTGGIRVW
ncbi:MAG TPA: hypothetical protein VH277_13935 [Gemmatimonadaceae bacterium]|jgi:hypothetical protein|nr:hypothetical protein [Gemmatimonadaceae bacterium]